jgi:hypothetical protein
MRTPSFSRGRVLLLALFVGSHLSLTGCSDDSRTSGTVVEVSPEAEKALENRKAGYKARKSVKEQSKPTKDQSKSAKFN